VFQAPAKILVTPPLSFFLTLTGYYLSGGVRSNPFRYIYTSQCYITTPFPKQVIQVDNNPGLYMLWLLQLWEFRGTVVGEDDVMCERYQEA
jgi:hypothetical protein